MNFLKIFEFFLNFWNFFKCFKFFFEFLNFWNFFEFGIYEKIWVFTKISAVQNLVWGFARSMKEKANYPNNKNKNNKFELFLAFRRKAKSVISSACALHFKVPPGFRKSSFQVAGDPYRNYVITTLMIFPKLPLTLYLFDRYGQTGH